MVACPEVLSSNMQQPNPELLGAEASLRGGKCPALGHHLRRSGHSGLQTKAMRERKVIGRSPATPEGPRS